MHCALFECVTVAAPSSGAKCTESWIHGQGDSWVLVQAQILIGLPSYCYVWRHITTYDDAQKEPPQIRETVPTPNAKVNAKQDRKYGRIQSMFNGKISFPFLL